ncbi:MAG TPA: hypothetical protein VMN36_13780 [Verrucomicrobiales bacterium]|nr:hypothetical protein [Verrucomicrobiales bacterium]
MTGFEGGISGAGAGPERLSRMRVGLRCLFWALLCCAPFVLGSCGESVKFSSEDSVEGVQPWARPESWEGRGRYGSMMPQSR